MASTINNAFKIAIIIFLAWIGFCAYEYSQNNRYKSIEGGVIDTRSGIIYLKKRPTKALDN